jgi:hypothetical protein
MHWLFQAYLSTGAQVDSPTSLIDGEAGLMTTYDVTVTRDSGLWVATVDGLPPNVFGLTDVDTFSALDTEVRDLIAGLTQTPPDSFDLQWRYVIDSQDS